MTLRRVLAVCLVVVGTVVAGCSFSGVAAAGATSSVTVGFTVVSSQSMTIQSITLGGGGEEAGDRDGRPTAGTGRLLVVTVASSTDYVLLFPQAYPRAEAAITAVRAQGVHEYSLRLASTSRSGSYSHDGSLEEGSSCDVVECRLSPR
jgi:hypothetical protein